MDISLDEFNQMSDVVSTEIIEDVFNRKGRRKLEQQAQQQKKERRHVDGWGWGTKYKSSITVILDFSAAIGWQQIWQQIVGRLLCCKQDSGLCHMFDVVRGAVGS